MEPTRDEAGTDRDRLAAVTEKKGGPGVPEPGRADEEAPPAVEEGPLKAGGRTGEEPEPDTAGQDPPRSAGRTGVFPEIAAGWARTLGAITEEIPIVVIEDDGEERAPRADDEPAEDPGAAEDSGADEEDPGAAEGSGADEEDPRDAGGGAEDPEPGGDAVEGPFDGPQEAVREEPAQEMPEAADETRVVEESAEISQAADEPAQEAPEAGDVGVVPDRTEELPVVVEAASPPEVSEPVEPSGAAAEPSEGLEEADGEDVPRAVEEPVEAPDAAVEAPEADEGSSEGLEADEGEPHDAGSGDSRGAVSAPEAGDVGVVPDRTEEFPVVAEAASPPEASEAEERPSDGLEESVEEEPAADPRDAAEDAVEGSPEGLGESGEEVPQAVEGPSAAPWDTASPAAAPRVADVSGASEADGRDTRGAGPAQEIPETGEEAGEPEEPEETGEAGEAGEPEEAEEPAEAGQAPDVTTLRAAETPDAAPVDLPAAKADLPPSYPPPRRSRRARARSGSSPRRRRRWIPHRSTILVVVIVVALTALFKTFVIQWFEIPSGSMENTLEVGDEVAVTMYDAQDLERGDVVVFTDPDHWLDVEDPTGLRGVIRDTLVLIHLLPENTGHYLIKRVIGVPGDHIVADGRGSLTVNGAPLNETYLKNGASPSEVAFDVVVPEGFIWVMGDNRSNSADSRYHQDDAHGGFVPIADVAGVAKVVVWPISHWRGLGGGHEAFDDVPEPGRAPVPAAPAPEDGA